MSKRQTYKSESVVKVSVGNLLLYVNTVRVLFYIERYGKDEKTQVFTM